MKPKKLSQKANIRNYLEHGGHLTQMAALNFWKCMRLASRISEINEDLYIEWFAKMPFKFPLDSLSHFIPIVKLRQIKTEMVKTSTGKFVAEYSLERVD